MTRKKVAIFCGNVSTYHTPIFKKLALRKDLDIKVMFGSDEALRPFFNKEFNHTLHFDKNIVNGFKHKFFYNFLENDSRRGFFCRINPGMFFHILFNRYEYVIIFGYDTFSSWLVYFASLLSNKKIIWRGEAIERQNRAIIKIVKNIILPIYFKFTYKICFSCEQNKKYLSKYSKDINKFVFFPSAVDNNFYQKERSKNLIFKEEIYKIYNISQDKLKILIIGRLTKRKNVIEVLKSIKKINKKNIQVLIIGDGPEMEKINNYISQSKLDVICMGYLNQNEVCRVYSVSNLLCIFSHYDASPKVINEVMNFAMPIIARNTVGTTGDLVINEHNGYVVKNDQELRKAIEKLSSDFNLVKVLGLNSLEIINTKFNIDTIVNNIAKICR